MATLEINGRRVEVDDNFRTLPPEQQQAVVDEIAAQMGAAPARGSRDRRQSPPPGGLARVGDTAAGLGSSFAEGMQQGVSMLLGAPFDILNSAPALSKMLPGGDAYPEDWPDQIFPGVSGSESWQDVINLPVQSVNLARGAVGADPLPIDYESRNVAERVSGRIGQEVGATLLPLWGAAQRARSVGDAGVASMSALERTFVEPMIRNPGGVAAKEMQYAAAAGGGAQGAAEVFTADNEGNIWTELLGALGGMGVMGASKKATGTVGNLIAGATNSPGMMDDMAGEAIVDQIINNSSMMGEQAAPYLLKGQSPQIDTQPLADALRRPAPVEQAIPGYRADIGVRSGDPALQTFVQDANARSAGVGNTLRSSNNTAVGNAVDMLAPSGNAPQFRLDLQSGVDQRIFDMMTEEDLARLAFSEHAARAAPTMPNETARGSNIRAALDERAAAERGTLESMYGDVYQSGQEIPVAPLAERFGAVDDSLPMNDRIRFRPGEANLPERLAPPDAGGPVETGLLDAQGRPIMREPPQPPDSVPLREITSVRSGLSNDIGAANSRGEPQAARVGRQYRDELDAFLEEALEGDLAEAYGNANAARLSYGQRFETDGSAIADTLRRDGRGEFRLDESAIPGRFAQTDRGKITDYQALMREAGTDPRARESVADQILADAQRMGVVEQPARLAGFLDERSVMLADFPELRSTLEQAGVSRQTLDEAARATAETRTAFERGPEGRYLKYDDNKTRESVRTILNSPKPTEAVQQILRTAGDTPETRVNLRTALWEEVKGRGVNRASDQGSDVWNATRVRGLLNDPSFDAVAKELWRDDPEDLGAIRELFTSLEAATLGRRNASGSPGTAAAISGRLDPSITTTGIASRARSVSRNQLSPVIAVVDGLSTWMRNKSKQVQARAIDAMAAQVVNNPGLAADLLEDYNPATYAARRAMLTQKYGVRLGSLLEILDQAHEDQQPSEDDELMGAIEE